MKHYGKQLMSDMIAIGAEWTTGRDNPCRIHQCKLVCQEQVLTFVQLLRERFQYYLWKYLSSFYLSREHLVYVFEDHSLLKLSAFGRVSAGGVGKDEKKNCTSFKPSRLARFGEMARQEKIQRHCPFLYHIRTFGKVIFGDYSGSSEEAIVFKKLNS